MKVKLQIITKNNDKNQFLEKGGKFLSNRSQNIEIRNWKLEIYERRNYP